MFFAAGCRYFFEQRIDITVDDTDTNFVRCCRYFFVYSAYNVFVYVPVSPAAIPVLLMH
jgi:hypothetical protein